VGGVNEASTSGGGALRRGPRSRGRGLELTVAESCKLLENVFRSVNIALVNELKTIFDRMHIDVWEVIEAAKTKPFGFMPFYPGPGLGGHCIPLDRSTCHGRQRSTARGRFIELAGENQYPDASARGEQADARVEWAWQGVEGLARVRSRASLQGQRGRRSRVTIIRDHRVLREMGAHVEYCDPYFRRRATRASTATSACDLFRSARSPCGSSMRS